MERPKGMPWTFVIEFDEDKAEKNGYDLDDLYDYVGKNVEKYGVTRIARGTWKAEEGREVESQCPALCMLSDAKWIMQNIKSLTVFENSGNGFDGLDVIRRHNPERLLV